MKGSNEVSENELQGRDREIIHRLEEIGKYLISYVSETDEQANQIVAKVGSRNLIVIEDSEIVKSDASSRDLEALENALSGNGKPKSKVRIKVNGKDALSISEKGRVSFDDLNILGSFQAKFSEMQHSQLIASEPDSDASWGETDSADERATPSQAVGELTNLGKSERNIIFIRQDLERIRDRLIEEDRARARAKQAQEREKDRPIGQTSEFEEIGRRIATIF
ncbi:MAG: hypothetical protein AAGB19_18295, partial [Cyanobacteria bacterium P01_F01_bin.3]